MTHTPWPLREARRLLDRSRPSNRPVLFEAGFGPSGPPHVGTLAECLRTSWVARAWTAISGESHRLVLFCDDMDGLRRAPSGMEEQLDRFRGLPLCRVPDPSGRHPSWGEANLSLLLDMLNEAGLEYEVRRSSSSYRRGDFDAALLCMVELHEQVAEVVRPTLGEALRQSWSPFMPLHPRTGHVLSVPVTPVPEEGAVEWRDRETGQLVRTPVYGGHAKLGWKADWGMRWAALGVDWEMNGKDLAENRPLSERICAILGGNPPLGMTAELLLDENGAKLSKSRGSGMTVDEWVSLGGHESLGMLLMGAPEEARRFHAGLVPACIDALATGAGDLVALETSGQPARRLMEEPSWYVLQEGSAASHASCLRFPLILGAARMLRGQPVEAVLRLLQAHAHRSGGSLDEGASRMASHAHSIVVAEGFTPRAPVEEETRAILSLVRALRGMTGCTAEEIQSEAYRVGKEAYGKAGLRSWFAMLYEVLLGQPDGPRFGHLAEVIGVENTVVALENAALGSGTEPVPSPGVQPR